MTRAPLALVAALACMGAPNGLAQTTFKSGIKAVRLDVSVMRDGRPLRGLTADDFIVTDNDVPQRLESVALDTAPLNVVMALDNSGSMMGEKMTHLIDAATAVVNDLRAADQGALITFSEQVERRVALTSDRDRLTRGVSMLHAAGGTALRDGILAALALEQDEAHRTVLLVFSDGQDTASWLTERNILEAVRRGKPIVHAIEIPEERLRSAAPPTRTTSPNADPGRPPAPGSTPLPGPFLEVLTRTAGGRYWRATKPEQLRAVFRAALDDMRTRYELTFYPPVPNRQGWHRVDVRLKRGSATIAARPGYLVESSRP
ncbi:MAG TPA: VWA domain-containing protein [Vicinamibacterales bacterium]|jgi:VWFA-related protein